MSEKQWAIVGGGLLGMTLAYELSRRGRQVTLFEAASTLGGLASTWEIGGITWDRHYHVTLYSDQFLRGILSALDLDRQMCWRKTQTGFYSGGSLHPFTTTIDFARFPVLTPLEKIRLAATILRASRFQRWQELENISVEQWLTQLSGAAVFQKIWRPLLKAKLGDDYQSTSATFIWATMQRMYAARRSGLKQEFFGYLPGGYSRMLDAYQSLLERMGVSIRVNARVQNVSCCARKQMSVRLSSGETICFERVIMTAPAPIAAALCPELTDAEKASLGSVSYLGIICASALLRKPLSRFYITNILDETIPFTGLIEMSALVDQAEFGNRHLIYIPRYLRPDHPDFTRSDADLEREMLDGVHRMHPTLDERDVLACKLSRVRYVFPRPQCASRDVPPVDMSVTGLHLVNSAHILNGTLNANETVSLAQKEAQRLHETYQ